MSKKTPRLSLVVLEFLGSMNLAIMLLCAVAVSSIIGTILQQNKEYIDYVSKFGPFWTEVYTSSGLTHLYATAWFLGLNAFLVISTAVCIYRNAPGMLREIGQWRDNVQHRSLAGMQQKQEWGVAGQAADHRDDIAALLGSAGYQVRAKVLDGATLVAAKKGMFNRLGYILAHASIVVICIGGAMDSSFQFSIKEKLGQLKTETRNIPASEVPAISWLPEDNWSFRGNVNLPEGSSADLVFLNQGDGYYVQKLPFEIELKDFRIEHYKTGQPKSFESDLVIHDPDLNQPVEQTIAVNHPLIHKGVTIYQASFQDGGSELKMKAWPLYGNKQDAQEWNLEVFNDQNVVLAGRKFTLEADDFRLFNINPVEGEGEEEFKNFGPNFTFRLRNAAGQAIEYQTYQLPLEFEGRWFYTSGMRASPAEPFKFLHIPVDEKFGLDRFANFLGLLHDPQRMEEIIYRSVAGGIESEAKARELTQPMLLLLSQFLHGGYQAIISDMEQRVPEANREAVFSAYLKVLRSVLGSAYRELLGAEPTEEQWTFYQEAVDAINAMSLYQSPVFVQLLEFKHIQASGLQVTKSPGTFWVYLGCAMLTAGVFMLFYLNRQRLWVWLEGDQLLFAGQSHRKTNDFPREFERLSTHLQRITTPSEEDKTE